jgi:hypothetical protein
MDTEEAQVDKTFANPVVSCGYSSRGSREAKTWVAISNRHWTQGIAIS